MATEFKDVADKNKPNYFRRFLITMGAAIVYAGGNVAYYQANNMAQHTTNYYNLLKEKSELTEKIRELNRYVPMMKEPFKSQHQDSLLGLAGKALMNDIVTSKLKEKIDDVANKSLYSWAAFFMEE